MSLLSLALSLSLAAAPPPAYDAELSTYAYPFPVRFQRVQAQGQALRMAYMDVAPARGVKANGRTVLLLHGKNFSGAYWERTARALSARGYRVVIPDQVGFGKSSKPVSFQYSLHALAAHTRALLESLGVERAAVVGHSMGGMVAVRFALLAPER
ncbi:MAG TPA: alpha/beta fold hydrolase, partial [Aggregicoccus sp.]|nr:alpha/beta fold hydrolase [Aggregicoccus sp.]